MASELGERIDELLATFDPEDGSVDVSAAPVDAVTVDALARLQLEARRRGARLRLREPPLELRQLIELMGLDDALTE